MDNIEYLETIVDITNETGDHVSNCLRLLLP